MRKKNSIALVMLLSMLFCAASAWAQIDQLSNMSAEWIRTGNRNAATDSTDIVVYNPAGLTKMSDGIHLNIGNQMIFRSPEHTFDLGLPASNGEKSYEQDSPDYFLPNVYGAYNKGPYSLFGGVYIPGNGAVVDYPDGSINTQFIGAMTVLGSGGLLTSFRDDYLKVESTYLASELGVAYNSSCHDEVSFALALRYINAQNKIKSGATFIDAAQNPQEFKLRYNTDADGVGAVAGMNIAASEDVNIGLRYESKVVLDFKTDLDRNDFPEEFDLVNCHETQSRDLPAMAGIGLEYRICPKLTSEVDFNYYFQEDADWGKSSQGKDLSDLAGDCWGVGGALGYQLYDNFVVSIGTIYTQFDWGNMDDYYETIGAFEVLYTDNWFIGTGFAWKFQKNLTLNFSVGQTIWEDETIEYVRAADNGFSPVDVDTENATTTVAYSLDMAF